MLLHDKLLLHKKIQSILETLLLEAKEDLLRSQGVSEEIITFAKEVIEALPLNDDEQMTIREAYLDWIANIYKANEKNKEKNAKQDAWVKREKDAGNVVEPVYLPVVENLKSLDFQRILIVAYKEGGIDLKSAVNINNFNEKANEYTRRGDAIIKKLSKGSSLKKIRERYTKLLKGKLAQEDVYHTFDDGRAIVALNTPIKQYAEGHLQNICLKEFADGASTPTAQPGYVESVARGSVELFSLRTPDNMPIATAELIVGEPNFKQIMMINDAPASSQIKADFNTFKAEYLKDKIAEYTAIYRAQDIKSQKIVKTYLAKSESTPIDVLIAMGENEKDKDILSFLVNNTSLPDDLRISIIEAFDLIDQKRKIALETQDGDILTTYSTDEDERVRINVASNHYTPTNTLSAMVQDVSQAVAEALVKNTKTPRGALTELYDKYIDTMHLLHHIARHRNVHQNVLYDMHKKNITELFPSIAENDKAPTDLLHTLAKLNDDTIWDALVERNEATTVETLLYIMTTGNSFDNTNVFAKLFSNKKLAQDVKGIEYALTLYKDDDFMLATIGMSQHLPLNFKIQMAKHPKEQIRYFAMYNNEPEVLRILAKDTNDLNREHAIAQMKALNIK